MQTRLMTATITAATLAATMTLNAQTPQTQPQTRPQTDPQTQTDRQRQTGSDAQRNNANQTITLTGCLRAEKDVPGRSQSITERAGMGEDYILTNVKMAQGASTSGIGVAQMYQIKGGSVDESELKKHLGHQVEVVGRLENMSGNRGMSGTGGTGTGTTGGGTTATGGTGGTGTGGTGTGTAGTTGTTGTTGGGTGTAGTGGTGTARGTGTTAGGGNSGGNLPNFEATSLRMIATTCSAQ